MGPFDVDMFEPNLFPVEPETFSETLHRREASARKTLLWDCLVRPALRHFLKSWRNADMSEWGETTHIFNAISENKFPEK